VIDMTMNQSQRDAVQAGVVNYWEPYKCQGEFIIYHAAITESCFRIGNFQARRGHNGKFDIFENGSCVETGIESEKLARQHIAAKMGD
jgi:hypothetical protein